MARERAREVELVTSDAHQGRKDAIATIFAGASWQRCRTHCMTNLLTRGPAPCPTVGGDHGEDGLPAEVQAQHARMVGMLDERYP